MGQAKVWQVLYSLSMGQVTPPWRLVLRTERLRFLVPVAQVLVQALKAVQAETLQSMGQAKVLQVLMELKMGQARPRKAAATTVERVRFLVPVAQVAEQAVKADQRETLQSTGQPKVLQVLCSFCMGQATPLKR
jgi:hypothetical protein